MIKGFDIEPTSYEKTIISDLHVSWVNLRNSVVENFGSPDSDKLLFHIDGAMSWESVRSLKKMEATSLLIQNIASQAGSSDEVIANIEEVRQCLKDVFDAITEGEAR